MLVYVCDGNPAVRDFLRHLPVKISYTENRLFTLPKRMTPALVGGNDLETTVVYCAVD